MATEPPVDNTPIVLSPATFDRHEGAAKYVEGLVKTVPPRGDRSRGPQVKPGAWGLLIDGDTIAAGAGLTLGQGEVKLCTQEGNLLTATANIVTVQNAGDAITAGPGDLVVRLAWTDGRWAVSCGGQT